MRRAAKRDENEGPIVTALRKAGAQVHHLSMPGVADLMVQYRRRITLLEVKDPAKSPSRRRLTPAQEEFHRSFEVRVVLTPEEALRAIGAIRPLSAVEDVPAQELGFYR